MKRHTVVGLALTLLAGACGDDDSYLVGPEVGEPSFIADHTSINTPSIVSAAAIDDGVLIEWTWTDADDNWDLVSFEVERDGEDAGGTIPNVKPYTEGDLIARSWSESGLEDGTYEYCVKVMAKYRSGPGEPEVTNHSFSCREVTVGSVVYTVEALDGNIADGEQNRNAANFTLTYRLLSGSTVVSCSIPVAVTVAPSGQIDDLPCVDGVRELHVENPSKGTVTTYVLTFVLTDGQAQFTFDTI